MALQPVHSQVEPTGMTNQSFAPDGFPHLAQDAFDFLIHQYGYRLQEAGEHRVVWRSDKAEVAVEFDERARELDVLLRPRSLSHAGVLRTLRGDRTTPLGLADIASWRGARDVLKRLPVTVEPLDLLPARLEEMAQALRSVADPLLRGETREILAADRHMMEHARRMTRQFGRR